MLKTYWGCAWRSVMLNKYFLINLAHFFILDKCIYWIILCVNYLMYPFKSFPHSVNIARFCWITYIAFVWFWSNLHNTLTKRQCMFGRKKGAELCHFLILTVWCCNMAVSVYFVKLTPPRPLSVSFLILCMYVTDILKMCMKKFNAE